MSFFIISLFVYLTINGQAGASKCKIAQACITDLSQSDCDAGSVLVPNTWINGCCPSCTNPDDGGDEDDDDVNPTEVCRPPSNCLENGQYAPVQCKGDTFTGRCFCSDEKGNRIFGQMWRSEAQDMKCACSRRRHEIENSEKRISTLHCSPSGDYERLQCDNGICWCADPSTGQPTAPPLPQEDMKILPCHSAGLIGENYLRRCESIVNALAGIAKDQAEHGTNFLGNPTTFCDYDGSYGPYQIQNGIAYCTGRDGKILGSWQVVSSSMAGMNCNCARDTMIYLPEKGMTVSEVCLPNGNYRAYQNAGDVPYCVDSDGYPIERDQWPRECINNTPAPQ
ncbi:thyroglobulin-like [Danaus plexippus]|uniref:thyroglobulin-like n=1 Tax=Danaus plexippus TaxID=13037 RepID=UPI002AAFDB1E|nr:thyroglobulin-like [Danaus plexippus]